MAAQKGQIEATLALTCIHTTFQVESRSGLISGGGGEGEAKPMKIVFWDGRIDDDNSFVFYVKNIGYSSPPLPACVCLPETLLLLKPKKK